MSLALTDVAQRYGTERGDWAKAWYITRRSMGLYLRITGEKSSSYQAAARAWLAGLPVPTSAPDFWELVAEVSGFAQREVDDRINCVESTNAFLEYFGIDPVVTETDLPPSP